MPGPKRPPEYFEARRALNQHLHRHHYGATGSGTLEERFEQHDRLHLITKRAGIPPVHVHGEYPENESDLQAALRLLKEGEDGQANATTDS